MQIDLYYTTDTPIKADKTLTALGTLTGTPTSNININSPVFKVTYSNIIPSVNYAYIPDFGKYYFVKPPTLNTDGSAILELSVDVLKTYGAAIKNCDAVVIRSQSIGSNDVPDSRLPVNPNSVDVVSVMGSKSFNKYSTYSPGGGVAPQPVTQIVLITGRGKE